MSRARDVPDSGAPGLRGAGEGLHTLVSQVWGPIDPAGPVRVTTGTAAPKGYRPVECYVPLPSLARARFLVPANSSPAAGASLRRYNRLRTPKVRLARHVLGLGLSAGVAQAVLRDRITVSLDIGISDRDADQWLLTEHLRKVLGIPDLVVAIGVRAPNPHHKPLLQLFDTTGSPRGYAKVGWNVSTRRRVTNETLALLRFQAAALPSLRLPELMHAGRFRDAVVSVTAPLPSSVRPPKSFDIPPTATVSTALAVATGTTRAALPCSAYWRRLRRRAEAVHADGQHEALAVVLKDFLRLVEREAGARMLNFGSWHGDWAPWNVGYFEGVLWAWDWEHSSDDVPLGFDVVHWLFQVAYDYHERSVRDAYLRARSTVPAYLAAAGVDAATSALLTDAYLVECCLRAYEIKQESGRWRPNFYPAILDVLAEATTAQDTSQP